MDFFFFMWFFEVVTRNWGHVGVLASVFYLPFLFLFPSSGNSKRKKVIRPKEWGEETHGVFTPPQWACWSSQSTNGRYCLNVQLPTSEWSTTPRFRLIAKQHWLRDKLTAVWTHCKPWFLTGLSANKATYIQNAKTSSSSRPLLSSPRPILKPQNSLNQEEGWSKA